MPEARTVELTLPGVTASVPSARRFVRSTLRSWELDEFEEAAALVVSELATNAVLHARSAFTVRLSVDSRGLRVEVVDGSQRQPALRGYSAGSATGRGLAIVQDLATDWGVVTHPDGKSVWVQLLSGGQSHGSGVMSASSDAVRAQRRHTEPHGPTVRAA